MKKRLLGLIICLLIPLSSFCITTSDSIATNLTVSEVRTLNNILIEHYKWSKQVPLYKYQILNYQKLIENNNKVDSLRMNEIKFLNIQVQKNEETINKLNKSLKVRKIFEFGEGCAIIALILGFICK